MPSFFRGDIWGINISDFASSRAVKVVNLFLSASLLCFSSLRLAKSPILLVSYLIGISGFLLLNYLNIILSARHYGNLFILLIAYLWILLFYEKLASRSLLAKAQVSPVQKRQRRTFSLLLTLVLCFHFLSGIYSFSTDWLRPFSATKETAKFIESHQLQDKLIVGHTDVIASPISGFLDKKLYYLEIGDFGSFIRWNSHRNQVKAEEILKKTSALLTQSNELLLVSSRKIGYSEPDISVENLANFDESTLVKEERYYLYLIRKKTSTN